MATITDNDNSDLLILDEDSSIDNIIIDENITNEEVKPVSEELITFESEPTSETKLDITLDDSNETITLDTDESLFDVKSEEDTVNIESNDANILSLDEPVLDLGEMNTEIAEDDNEILPPDISTDDAFSLSLDLDLWETTTEELSEPVLSDNNSLEVESLWATSNEWTMEDILDDAMNKLDSRADSIASEISTEETNESDLKNQITDLEWQVKVVNEKISDLKSEKSLIAKNTKSLEKMKSADVTSELKNDTSNRVHNVKRRK